VTVPPEVATLFRRNGYVRRQSAAKRAAEGHAGDKKGDEVRLVVDSGDELVEVRRLPMAAGFLPGRAFLKARQWRQPVYGRAAVARFLALVGVPAADSTQGLPVDGPAGRGETGPQSAAGPRQCAQPPAPHVGPQ